MKQLLRTATLENLEEIIAYEKAQLVDQIEDEMDREMHSWNARWRQESLEHYLRLGWSMVLRDEDDKAQHPEGRLLGYFLAQPLLFFEGQTQTLWVEHMGYDRASIKDVLVDTVYRLAREKHLQRLLFSESARHGELHPQGKPWSADITAVATTKG